MSGLVIRLTSAAAWQEHGGVRVRGSAFAGSSLLYARDIAVRLAAAAGAGGFDGFVRAVSALNGFFSIIAEPEPGVVFAAVDVVRSQPLFYAVPAAPGAPFLFSDQALWLRNHLGPSTAQPEAAAEFLLAGYVTGRDTLHPAIKQLRAAEALAVRIGPGQTPELESRRYSAFAPSSRAADLDQATLTARLDDAIKGACGRLCAFAAGRRIVIPLSGGFDSRLIALTVKNLGYDNLIAFTYGRPEGIEARISKSVAETLRIPWHFVPYDNETWAKWYASNERARYFALAHQLVSVPHIQDYPSIGALCREGVIDADAVVVPGHSGDFTAGSHIPPSFLKVALVGRDRLIQHMYARHFRLWRRSDQPREVLVALEARVVPPGSDGVDDPLQAILYHDRWDFEERQAKFIVNSVRAYEAHGLGWWLPLFDRAFLDFWSTVPLTLRIGQRLYNDYVTTTYAAATGIGRDAAAISDKRTLGMAARRWVRRLPFLVPAARALFDQLKKRRAYDREPLAMFGIVDRARFSRLYTGRENVNSFIARDVLGDS